MDLRIDELLRARGVSQSRMAADLGVTQSTVSKWCTGESSPPTKKLGQIARYFGVDPLELFASNVLTDAQRRLLVKARQLDPADAEIVESLIESLAARRER